MKKLIQNTILVLVMVFLGLFLTSCEKNNPQPEPQLAEWTINLSTEVDSVSVRLWGVNIDTAFNLYRGKPQTIKIKESEPNTFSLWGTVSIYRDVFYSSPSHRTDVILISDKGVRVEPKSKDTSSMWYTDYYFNPYQ